MSELEFRLPDVGEGLDSGEIVEWHVEPGSRVSRDQVLVDVETDKSLVELPSPVDGVVVRLGGDVGDVLEVGAVLIVLQPDQRPSSRKPGPAAGSPAAEPAPAPEPASASASIPAEAPVAALPDPPAAVDGGRPAGRRALASPATRKLALELGVDLSAVTGSGPGGRISNDDVRSFADRPAGAAAPAEPAAEAPEPGGSPTVPAAEPETVVATLADETVPLRGLRRQIAKTMSRSWREVPHITDFREVDATALVAARNVLRRRAEKVNGTPFTFLPLLVKAVVATLAEHPKFNASVDMDAETITYHGRRNIGLATATDAGLIVPVLKDADTRSLADIASQIELLANAARSRTVTTDQTSQGTFTITNFGSFGGWIATPIIRPPEAAIAGFGRIRDAVVAVDGVPVVRPTLPLSVSADHRLIDGDDMGGFLNTLSAYLEDPILLVGP
jgi:pyruvate/2-oxoglutarate dehydrogenase complex dihydrolipoamide acyltransferase (E2) component